MLNADFLNDLNKNEGWLTYEKVEPILIRLFFYVGIVLSLYLMPLNGYGVAFYAFLVLGAIIAIEFALGRYTWLCTPHVAGRLIILGLMFSSIYATSTFFDSIYKALAVECGLYILGEISLQYWTVYRRYSFEMFFLALCNFLFGGVLMYTNVAHGYMVSKSNLTFFNEEISIWVIYGTIPALIICLLIALYFSHQAYSDAAGLVNRDKVLEDVQSRLVNLQTDLVNAQQVLVNLQSESVNMRGDLVETKAGLAAANSELVNTKAALRHFQLNMATSPYAAKYLDENMGDLPEEVAAIVANTLATTQCQSCKAVFSNSASLKNHKKSCG